MIIEIGPTASLLGMGRRCVPELEAAWLPSLREGQDDWQVHRRQRRASTTCAAGRSIGAAGTSHGSASGCCCRIIRSSVRGIGSHSIRRCGASWGGDVVRRCDQRRRHKQTHPLLGPPLSTVWTNTLFEARLSMRSPAYLVDHQVQGSAVTPAAAYIEQGLAAADEVFGPGRHGLANLVIQQAMFCRRACGGACRFRSRPESGGEATFETYSRPEDDERQPRRVDDARHAARWCMNRNAKRTAKSNESILDAARGSRRHDHCRTTSFMN